MKKTLLPGNRLILIFGVISAITVLHLLVGLASIPEYWQRVASGHVESVLLGSDMEFSNDLFRQAASQRGMSLFVFAGYHVTLNLTAAMIQTAMAVLLVWRAPRNWFAWYSAFIALFLAGSALNEHYYVARPIPQALYGSADILWALVLPYLYLFPDGRVVPRRSLWITAPLFVFHFLVQALTVASYFDPEWFRASGLPVWGMGGWVVAPVVVNFFVVFACQVYRYLRVATLTERLQMKWFLYGLGVMVVLASVVSPLASTFASVRESWFVQDLSLTSVLFIPLPVTLAVSVLRYRLWDIDVLIRRTLAYAILTALLGLVYFGGVTLLQRLFTATSGQSSPAALVISTLLIAALFNPLRRRIQDFIDRRFYRRKYDAEKALAHFAATARHTTDVEHLSAELRSVVQETVQPESTGLWLRGSGNKT